ncbi:MAG: MFS transporter [Pirellulaceae bacterium]|nr:MFS transporter [Pirellulaceae bacterium]
MKYYVLYLLCLAAIIAYVQRLAFSVCEQHIRVDLELDKAQIGQIMAAWQLGYALMQLPSGWLADRIGSRRSLAIFIVAWSGMLGVAAWCTNYTSLITAWCLMGMAQAGVFPCSTKLIGEQFGETFRATASGFLASSMALGIALAPLLTTQLLEAGHSWQTIFGWYVIPGWLWASVFFFSTPNKASMAPQHEPATGMPVVSPKIRWMDFLTSVPMWLLCGQQFFRAAAMMFFQSWFPTFLRETRGVDLAASGKLAFVVGIGALLGGMSGGIFSDWLLRRTGNRRLARQGIALTGMLSCGCLIGLSYFISNTNLAIACVSLGAFLATFGGVSGYTMAIEFGGKHVAKTFSIMNMCGNIGAALFPLLAGYISEGPTGWTGVLFLSVIILVVDAICWALLNPTHTISGESLKYEKS